MFRQEGQIKRTSCTPGAAASPARSTASPGIKSLARHRAVRPAWEFSASASDESTPCFQNQTSKSYVPFRACCCSQSTSPLLPQTPCSQTPLMQAPLYPRQRGRGRTALLCPPAAPNLVHGSSRPRCPSPCCQEGFAKAPVGTERSHPRQGAAGGLNGADTPTLHRNLPSGSRAPGIHHQGSVSSVMYRKSLPGYRTRPPAPVAAFQPATDQKEQLCLPRDTRSNKESIRQTSGRQPPEKHTTHKTTETAPVGSLVANTHLLQETLCC